MKEKLHWIGKDLIELSKKLAKEHTRSLVAELEEKELPRTWNVSFLKKYYSWIIFLKLCKLVYSFSSFRFFTIGFSPLEVLMRNDLHRSSKMKAQRTLWCTIQTLIKSHYSIILFFSNTFLLFNLIEEVGHEVSYEVKTFIYERSQVGKVRLGNRPN